MSFPSPTSGLISYSDLILEHSSKVLELDSSPPFHPLYTSPSLFHPPHHSDLGVHGVTLLKVIPVHPPLGGGGGGHPLLIVDMGSTGLIMSSLAIVVVID